LFIQPSKPVTMLPPRVIETPVPIVSLEKSFSVRAPANSAWLFAIESWNVDPLWKVDRRITGHRGIQPEAP
jgi:hypothetical protein